MKFLLLLDVKRLGILLEDFNLISVQHIIDKIKVKSIF